VRLILLRRKTHEEALEVAWLIEAEADEAEVELID